MGTKSHQVHFSFFWGGGRELKRGCMGGRELPIPLQPPPFPRKPLFAHFNVIHKGVHTTKGHRQTSQYPWLSCLFFAVLIFLYTMYNFLFRCLLPPLFPHPIFLPFFSHFFSLVFVSSSSSFSLMCQEIAYIQQRSLCYNGFFFPPFFGSKVISKEKLSWREGREGQGRKIKGAGWLLPLPVLPTEPLTYKIK